MAWTHRGEQKGEAERGLCRPESPASGVAVTHWWQLGKQTSICPEASLGADLHGAGRICCHKERPASHYFECFQAVLSAPRLLSQNTATEQLINTHCHFSQLWGLEVQDQGASGGMARFWGGLFGFQMATFSP